MNLAPALLAVAVLVMAANQSASARSEESVHWQIVVLNDEVDVEATVRRLEASAGFASALRYTRAIKGFAAPLSSRQVVRLLADAAVAYVAPDAPVRSADALPIIAGEALPTGVLRVNAATITSAHDSSAVAIAVVDTGIDLANPDLAVIDGINCMRRGASAQDDNGHGTHVAGVIAARNNGIGVVGVAPGSTVVAIKVLDHSGNGRRSQLICGIDWATKHAAALNIRVLNLSVTTPGVSDHNCGRDNHDALHRAVCAGVAAGINFVAAAGNSMADLATVRPAAYPEVLAVTAMADTDGLPGGQGASAMCAPDQLDDVSWRASNYALAQDEAHTIAAPGVCILSTFPGHRYVALSGTSVAAPHVAGAVALCIGTRTTSGPCAVLPPSAVVERVLADATKRLGSDPNYGFEGDPSRPLADRVFGPLVYVGGY
jgi:subtilisin